MGKNKNNFIIGNSDISYTPSTNVRISVDDFPQRSFPQIELPGNITPIIGKIDDFQQKIQERIFASTVCASAMHSSFRREYLQNTDNISLAEYIYSSENTSTIYWLEIQEVGISSQNLQNFESITEQLLQSIHMPEKIRIIFLITSDSEKIKIRLGFQSVEINVDSNIESVVKSFADFARSCWPGLKLNILSQDEVIKPFNFVTYKESKSHRNLRYYDAGIRCLSGLPAIREKRDKCPESNAVERLSNALAGKSWTLMIIAAPVDNTEIDKLIFTCRDLSGRAESMKSFQLGRNFSETLTNTLSQSHGEGTSSTVNQGGLMQQVAPYIPLICGVAALFCPALVPAALASAPHIVSGLVIGGGALAANSIAQSAKVQKTENFSEAISNAVSEASGITFGETVVNKHAEAMAQLLGKHLKRFSDCEALGAWDTGVFFIGEDENTAEVGANILKSLISGEDSYLEPIRIHNLKNNNGRFYANKDPFDCLSRFSIPRVFISQYGIDISHPLGKRFDSLNTILNSKEICQLINFPTKNIPGVPVHRIAPGVGLCNNENAESFSIGRQIHQGNDSIAYPYFLHPNSLSKHALVCGINGSGKTNTILGILNSISEKDIPFLVIEPAKQEYVDWAIESNQKLINRMGSEAKAKASKQWINVFIPGRTSWRGQSLDKLYLNPFDFVWLNRDNSPKTLEHIDRLKTIVNAALPMQEALPVLMEELIYMAYAVRHVPAENNPQKYPCWLPQGNQDCYPEFGGKVHIPNFQELARLIPVLFQKRNYAQDVSLNLKAALATRIDSFKRGWRKELLNKDYPRYQKEDWEKIFEHPTVINLTSLTSDEDKAFFMAIILLFVYEYRQELNELGANGKDSSTSLKHLLVVEEAHRVLAKCENSIVGNAAPKQKVSEMFSNMISEVRAYGQGIMVADQVPCRLNDDAIKNTNLKIVHKLVAADDRNAMATALNLWDDQIRIIGDLDVGEALIRGDMDKDVYMVKINKNKR